MERERSLEVKERVQSNQSHYSLPYNWTFLYSLFVLFVPPILLMSSSFSFVRTGRLVFFSLLVGASMELFMIHTGFYNTVVRKEAERRLETRERRLELNQLAQQKIEEIRKNKEKTQHIQ
jgi:hypothetical protein